MDKRREQILDMIKREFIGPDPLKDLKGMVQNNGEEILTSDPPRTRYLAGILFPQESLVEKNDIFEDDQIDYNSSCEEIVVTNPDKENVSSGKNELLENLEELMNLSYAYKQSAMSLTLTIKRNSIVTIDLHGAKYESLNQKDFESGFSKTYYYRKPFCWNNDNKPLELPSHRKRMLHYTISKNDVEQNIKLHITYRNQVNKFDADTYTFTMENTNIMDGGVIRDSDCFFQCGFKLHCQNGFSIMPENPRVNIEDQDYESNRLLYRHIKKYGIGHGCSVDWSFDNGHVTKVWTEIFPSYEIKPIVPSTIDGVSLEMHKMANQGSIDEVYREMDLMCSSYYEWIEDLVEDSKKLDDHNETAKKHIDNCKSCYDRMVDGVLLLRSNEKVRKAFMLMNEVMLMQQLHYNLPLSEWDFDDNNNVFLNKKYEFLPNKDDTKTWFGDIKRYGKWRPFQLAFILINLRSMFEKNSKSRDIVDLIWFPTGGGKTEAYLGLSAYTIFIRRLLNREDFGTTILMRYTLRLLTAQQYERAATMICACEMIRSKNVSELGEKRITIGLWVGVSTTPNRMSDAVKAYESLYAGSKDENPFIMLKCPWCGAQMGLIRKGHNKTIRGYKKTNERNKKIVFQCHNEECDFSKDGNSLPLMVVDEAIYEKPPTLLLGTVDKFAMLPYRPEAQNIFGIYNGVRKSSPDLIIQDELHLISGPLGSMVGHYETMVNELCIDRRNHSIVKPKIIASTATISKAKEQCHALYACGENNVFQFPPSGLSAGDSFFAYEDAAGIGRKYVGIFAPASSSLSTTSIRLYASLLYAANNIDVDTQSEKDPYWTNLAYFNSLRELGQTATWINADITEYLHVIYRRRREDLDSEKYSKRRYINRYEELTSRIRGDKIPENLQELGLRYPQPAGGNKPMDICLATNMISVGVDVPRLGLMTVAGQPKTTSEYIQATSRVGRDQKAPGIIFVVYSPGKPRDKSYYENFRDYHSKIYSYVEPTSVTPFSSPLRDRALHAILVGMVRLLNNGNLNLDPRKFPCEDEMERLFDIINSRVLIIDKDEAEDTNRHLKEILQKWQDESPQRYSSLDPGQEQVPLMYTAGSIPLNVWEGRGFSTPTSMRNVDAACEVKPLKSSYSKEVE